MEQEIIVNEHNKPPMNLSKIDTSLMINIADIKTSKLEYKEEVETLLTEAENYLSGFDWCIKIIDGWLAASFGYILNIFYFRIHPDYRSCQDEFVWIIVGDIPSAYIDVVSAPTAFDALKSYINVMQDWVDNVFNGNSVKYCYPVNVPPKKKYADMLAIRLKILKEDYLYKIQHTIMEQEIIHKSDFDTSPIIIYTTEDDNISLDVKLENETVWLSQTQMATLFGRDRTVIARHINNCFKEGELDRNITSAKFAHMGIDGDQVYETTMYNLDVIISVGYRVKSINGTRFRQWANKILKDYIIKGYAINDKIKIEHYNELKDVVRLLAHTVNAQEKLTDDQSVGLLSVVADYVYALDTLDRYDYQQLVIEKTTKEERFHATYENAMEVILNLKEKFGESKLFANEKDDSFKSSIRQIYQTFGGEELYPSIEEKAAMLLYLVIKNHSFSDGNKRIAAMLFLWFMERNGILYRADGGKRIADNTLVALTLMIAESRTEEKDIMVKVVVNLINQQNQ